MGSPSSQSRAGLLFLLDYNYLKRLYHCQSAYTAEWVYDAVMLPAGQSWETDVVCVPLLGLDGVAYVTGQWVFPNFPRRVVIVNEDLYWLALIVLGISVLSSVLGIAKALRVEPNLVLA